MTLRPRKSEWVAAAALLAFSAASVYAQSGCIAPGIGASPMVRGWMPPKISGLRRLPDGSWTLAQFNTANPFKMGSTIPGFQNDVSACAPAGHSQSAVYRDPQPYQMTAQPVAVVEAPEISIVLIAIIVGSSVSIYTGDANFAPVNVQSFRTGSLPTSVMFADLNGDGKPDLVVSDLNASNSTDNGDISVLLNKGDNTFQAPVKYMAGKQPINVTVGDVNGDGKPDLVTADNNGGTVSVLLGKGDGTFQSAVSYPAGSSPQGVILGDFNGDGKLDIAVGIFAENSDKGNVSVLLNSGNGTFKAPATVDVGGPKPWSLAAYDFDGDGKLDIAGALLFQPRIVVLHGKGDGTFTQAGAYAVDTNPSGVIVTDFNHDGIADLAIASGDSQVLGPDFGNGNMTFLLGNGDGTFRAPAAYSAGNEPASVAIADFNKDGSPDLIAGNNFSGDVTFLRGNGNGSFAPGVSIPLSPDSSQFGGDSLAAADLNGDGKPDIIAGDLFNGRVVVALGNGDGTFRSPRGTAVTGVSVPQVVAVDLNGDGNVDIVAAGGSSGFGVTPAVTGGVSVLLGAGDGTFRAPSTPLTGVNAASVAVADLNGDGKPDIAAANRGDEFATPAVPGSIVVLQGNGDGTFKSLPAMTIGATPANPLYVAAGDVNGDGRPDLAVAFVSGFSYGVH